MARLPGFFRVVGDDCWHVTNTRRSVDRPQHQSLQGVCGLAVVRLDGSRSVKVAQSVPVSDVCRVCVPRRGK